MATDNKTSVLVDSLLPEFLDTEGPKFQAFVKAYSNGWKPLVK